MQPIPSLVFTHVLYHAAGQALFERMCDKSSYNSLEGCPIIFLYRHALELYLKAIVLHGDGKSMAKHSSQT